ncbi:biopolymer transporter ExbD [bacterium]|nr:biopolymer transporter ExbD [bacterium]
MKLSKGLKANTNIPDSAMSDIAFLLIIFFMITTVFNKDQGLDLTLPQATKPETLEQTVLHVTLQKGDDGTMVRLEGKPVFIEALSAHIMVEGSKRANLYVVLKADGSIPYEIIKRVLNSIQEGYVNKVALAVDYKK